MLSQGPEDSEALLMGKVISLLICDSSTSVHVTNTCAVQTPAVAWKSTVCHEVCYFLPTRFNSPVTLIYPQHFPRQIKLGFLLYYLLSFSNFVFSPFFLYCNLFSITENKASLSMCGGIPQQLPVLHTLPDLLGGSLKLKLAIFSD